MVLHKVFLIFFLAIICEHHAMAGIIWSSAPLQADGEEIVHTSVALNSDPVPVQDIPQIIETNPLITAIKDEKIEDLTSLLEQLDDDSLTQQEVSDGFTASIKHSENVELMKPFLAITEPYAFTVTHIQQKWNIAARCNKTKHMNVLLEHMETLLKTVGTDSLTKCAIKEIFETAAYHAPDSIIQTEIIPILLSISDERRLTKQDIFTIFKFSSAYFQKINTLAQLLLIKDDRQLSTSEIQRILNHTKIFSETRKSQEFLEQHLTSTE